MEPDRRNLIFNGTFNGRIGTYLLSALGGTPRFLTSGVATFFAGGDSLLIGPTYRADSVYWVRVTGLDGGLRDSIRLVGNGQGVAALSAMPGTGWIVTMILQQPHGLWQVIDRSGTVIDHVVNACTCGGVATRDAMWVSRAGDGIGESIVRIAIDPATGKLATRQDTMVTGLFTNFSLTEDGRGMVMDEGTYEFNVWSLDFADLVKGRYPDDRRVLHASSPVNSFISPDGARVLIRKSVPVGGNHVETRFSIIPFAGGSETSIGGANPVVGVLERFSDRWDLRVRRRQGCISRRSMCARMPSRNEMDLPDSVLTWARALPDGWAWIPAAGDRLIVRRAGKTREYPKPPVVRVPLRAQCRSGAQSDLPRRQRSSTTGDSLG